VLESLVVAFRPSPPLVPRSSVHAVSKKLPFETLSALQTDFEDSDLPWKVDVLDINAIEPGFRKIVGRDKVLLGANEIAVR